MTKYHIYNNIKCYHNVTLCLSRKQIKRMCITLPKHELIAQGWPIAPDLEKAASGASGACRHFVQNHAILRTFLVKYPVLLTEDGGRTVEDGG